MANKLFFSVVIPTFNRADDLKRAIKLILDQTYKNFEIIISDNASTDNTAEIANSFKDKRIKYFKNKINIDVLPSLKKAVQLAQGEYILLQGDDDFIFNPQSLHELRNLILKEHPGYIRLNYLSLSPDKKTIFDFRASKCFKKTTRLSPGKDNLKIIDFLLKSDMSFIAGIVFKNELPPGLGIILSEPCWGVPIAFHATKKYGGVYVNKPYYVATWSQWRVREDNFNPLYSLVNGKLNSEKYFNFIKTKIDRDDFRKFLSENLFGIYVRQFMAIKLFTGKQNMLQLAARLNELDPELKNRLYFKLNFFIAFITPRPFLAVIRKIYLKIYIKKNNQNYRYNLEKIYKVIH